MCVSWARVAFQECFSQEEWVPNTCFQGNKCDLCHEHYIWRKVQQSLNSGSVRPSNLVISKSASKMKWLSLLCDVKDLTYSSSKGQTDHCHLFQIIRHLASWSANFPTPHWLGWLQQQPTMFWRMHRKSCVWTNVWLLQHLSTDQIFIMRYTEVILLHFIYDIVT